MSRLRSLKLDSETVVALAGTVFAASLLVLMTINAGPLWRDEVNTINVAQMPSLAEFWRNMSFESFPPLWPLLLRGCNALGLAGSDAGIRLLGLSVGLCVLVSFWLSARWLGCRAPILSIGLLGCLPAFIFIMGANRAYGLASCLLVLSFGTVWRMVESPTRGRILAAAVICFLFAHCVYYDVVFLAAILAAGGFVTLRRRQWKTLGVLTGIGSVSAISLAVYLPVIRQASPVVALMQWPHFSFWTLWDGLGYTVTARSSGELGRNGPEIWFWIALSLGGIIVALLAQQTHTPGSSTPETELQSDNQKRADRALFCVVSMLLGTAGLMAFLYHLHYLTRPWYYIELLCLCAISLDGLLGANWPALRPWGLLRAAFMLAMMSWFANAGGQEAHTRRSNVDLIAAALNQAVSKEDLIVVNSAWEGITLNRYYHGPAAWATVPPVDSHLVHRNDLVIADMNEPASLEPLLRDITRTLKDGHNVWFLGGLTRMRLNAVPTNLPPAWIGAHLVYWNSQISMSLLDHAVLEKVVKVETGGPVSDLENLPLNCFAGYREAVTNSMAPVHQSGTIQ